MKRKIIEHGTSNALIIPKKWFDKYGLKRGEELEVEESGPKLIVSAEKIKAVKDVIRIQQEPFVPYLHRVIGKIFQAGYDNIEIEISDKKDIDIAVPRALQEVMGLELIEKTDKKVVFDVMIQESTESFEKYEHKTFQTAIEYAKWVLECLVKKNYEGLFDTTLETLNDKFSLFCERHINKTLPKDCTFQYTLLWNLERIADEFKHIADRVKEKKLNISKESVTYFKTVIKYLEDFYHLFCAFDIELYSKMYQIRKNLVNEGYELCLKKRNHETIVIWHLITVVRTTFNCLDNLFAINISKFKLD